MEFFKDWDPNIKNPTKGYRQTDVVCYFRATDKLNGINEVVNNIANIADKK